MNFKIELKMAKNIIKLKANIYKYVLYMYGKYC